jgi:nucleoside-diphosphate-sugar epimerase
MRILVLGGTSFVGRAIVEDALRSGSGVTLFGRGKTGTGLFPGLTRLIGDRDTGDYTALRDGSWDAVVDVSGYLPRHVGQAMDALGDRAGRYLFISSHAVYRHEGLEPDSTEDAPRRPPRRDVQDTEELDNTTYGPSKVACEDDVLARYGSRATIVRPGKVAGPHDWQDGLTYWVRRAARGGRVAVPADPRQPVQVIDSRDLARLVVQLLADDRPGTFHAVGPAQPVTLGGLVETCARVAGAQAEIVQVPAGTATAMFPLIHANWATQQRSPARARAAGMPATPLAVTAADVLAWDRQRGDPPLMRGFTPEQEQAVLAQQDTRASVPPCRRAD